MNHINFKLLLWDVSAEIDTGSDPEVSATEFLVEEARRLGWFHPMPASLFLRLSVAS